MKSRGEYQSTPLSERGAGGTAVDAGSDAPSELAADAGALELPAGVARRTGIVFVHGIGNQTPAETFLDWSAPIVELLTDWRIARDGEIAPPAAGNVITDPVWRTEFAFSAASPPYLEINLPADGPSPQTTWVITEAWWAADIRPPDIGRTIDYLRRRMGTVIAGIATGYRERSPHLLDVATETNVLGEGGPPLSWRLIERLDWAQARAFGARPIGFTLAAVGTVVLIAYDLLRRIPIQAVQDFAVRKMVDSFLIDWFGDLPVLIDDPVQSANVRARLAGSIQRLKDDGCDAIVVVAHSGGALVSFETLLDPAYLKLHVDKLITLGQGLGLAWRLAADPDVHEITPGHRLVGNLAAVRPDLRWVDFWASYDPAPAGALPARGGLVASAAESAPGAVAITPDAADASVAAAAADAGVAGQAVGDAAPEPGPEPGTDATPTKDGRGPARTKVPASSAAIVETGEGAAEPWLVRMDVGTPESALAELAQRADLDPDTARIVVESRPVTNEMNVLTDHGGYWANPEGFLVPLVRHLDAAIGDAGSSRFFRDRADRTRRIIWRRQRVAALATWGWLCALTAIATIAVFIVIGLLGDARLARAGDALAAAWSYIPGHQLISGPIDGIGGLIQAMADAIGVGWITEGLASLGPPLLAVVFTVLVFFALAKIGNWRWHDWDRRERRAMLSETPHLPDRSKPAAQSIALIGGLIGTVFAAFGFALPALLAVGFAAVMGAVVWAARPFDG